MTKLLFHSVFFYFFLILLGSSTSAQTNAEKIVSVVYEFNMPMKIHASALDSVKITHGGKTPNVDSPFDVQDLLYKLHFTMKFTVAGNWHTSTIDLRNPDLTGSNFIGKVSTPEVFIFDNGRWSTIKDRKREAVEFRDVSYQKVNELKTILGYNCQKVLILTTGNEIEATAWVTNALPPTIVPVPGYRPEAIGGAVLAIESVIAGGNFIATKVTKD